MSEIRFYFDENVDVTVAEQLLRWNIDSIHVRQIEMLGAEDVDHLEEATKLGRALVTHDQDFLRIAGHNSEHTGIVFIRQYRASIGGMVRSLRALHKRMSAEAIQGEVVFLSPK